MKAVNINVLSAADNQDGVGDQIDAGQLYAASFHIYFGDANAVGTFKLQASNDVCPDNFMQQQTGFTVTNWIDLPNQSANITAGSPALLTIPQCAYKWLRCVYTDTGVGEQTITTVADASALAEISLAQAVADTGTFSATTINVPSTAAASQADYFVLSAPNGHTVAVWLNIDGAGTPPTGAAYLAADVQVMASILTLGTAIVNAGIVQAALNSVLGYAAVDNLDGTVTATESLMGPVAAPAKHNADDTGNGSFTFSGTASGVASNLNNTYYVIWSAQNANKGVVWFNVNGEGVQPVVAGSPVYIPVAIPASETADNIAVASTGPIAAAAGGHWNANASTDTTIIYNQATGPATDIADGAAPTGFALSVSQQGQNTGTPLLNDTYMLLNASVADGGTQYYLWFNVDSGGTDPMLPGKTGVPVALTGGATADQVAGALYSAISGLSEFSPSLLLNVIVVTNASAGPYTSATAGTTPFTVVRSSGGSSTINVNMNAQSV